MRLRTLVIAALCAPLVAHAQTAPVVLTIPAAPVPVTAAGRVALVYELHVTNAGSRPLRIERVEVRDPGRGDAAPVAMYSRKELERDTKLIAPRGAPSPKALSSGVRAVVYLWLALDSAAVPANLVHHVVFADGSTTDGASVPVRAPTDLVIRQPVGPGDWWIGLGPSNTSEHRRAVVRVGDDTIPHLAQRFAIDWVKMDSSGEYARDHRGRRNTDWYGYGEPVFAVADARVVAIVDGIPDNSPGEGSRAVPIKVGTVLGNSVLLDLGRATSGMHRYAVYGHLKSGTLRVRAGDSVAQGQILGDIGNSGNSDGPHLHFHVTEAVDAESAPLRGEGVPFVLESFTVVSHDPERVAQHAPLTASGVHALSLPVEGDVIRIPVPDTGAARSSSGLVAYIKATPDRLVATALGEAQATELWISNSDGRDARRLVVGAAADSVERSLAAFSSPRFSPDGRRLYFLSRAWVTSDAVHAVDVATGREWFVAAGNSLEIIPRGPLAGCLLATQHRYRPNEGGSYDATWLLATDGTSLALAASDSSDAAGRLATWMSGAIPTGAFGAAGTPSSARCR